MLKQLPKKKHLINTIVEKPLKSKVNLSTSKKAHFASVPKHQQTSHLWKIGQGICDKKQLTVILWNVNGFRSVLQKNQLQNLFKTYCQQADFICLNETKIDYEKYLQQTSNKRLQIKESQQFNQYWNFCKVSKGYSGVMTYSRHLPSAVIEDMPGFGNHNMEGRIMTLQYDKFYMVNLYKPNAGDKLIRLQYRLQYEDCFRDYIKKLQQKKPVIIGGDMNVANQQIDLKNSNKNQGKACFTKQQRAKFKQLLNQCNLSDSFRDLHPSTVKYSFWSYRTFARQTNSGWRLDYILVDKRLKVKQADILNNVYGSDHCPVIAKIQFP